MIAALILAAGQSKRMGQPKMLLPWGGTTVLGQVIETLKRAGVEDILIVTGGEREQVMKLVTSYGLRVTHNENFQSGEMLSSLQTGLATLRDNASADAALICLGDQPQVQEGSVRAVMEAFEARKSGLVAPSYQMRRGHPWLVARPLWEEILSMSPAESPRDFLNRHANEIEYVEVNTPSILADLDTYDDYLKSRPQRAIVEARKEAAMSDLTLIAEYIRDAMQSLERTRETGNGLRERVTRENYAQFRSQMNELHERLRRLNVMLLHEDKMALDELAAALDRAFDKPPAAYRHINAHGQREM